MGFSITHRPDAIARAVEARPDLLVIGGGITGAGIALDAVSRGLSVVLLEKNDFAWGTSSRSTKLIHGGLRYLKQLEFKLVSEVGRERAIVHRNARHLVVPERMLLPITAKGSLGRTGTSIGLLVYDLLAGVEPAERRKMLAADETARTEPLLKNKGLKAGALYYEYRSDDARLTIENIKRSVELGATCLNHAEVNELLTDPFGQVNGARFTDHLTGRQHDVQATVVVNACGPWVDLIRKKDDSLHGKRLQLTKGVHLVVPHERLPLRQAIYFDVPDGRMIFAIPRENITYVGTTDTVYTDRIDRPVTDAADVSYVLKGVNKMFRGISLAPKDVQSTWAGLRPLIHEDGKSPSELSRKDEIFHSPTGLISIAGGKLTGYRKMAERVVDAVLTRLPDQRRSGLRPCHTQDIRLTGGDFDDRDALSDYIVDTARRGESMGLDSDAIRSLIHRYGRQTSDILDRAHELMPDHDHAPEAALRAELAFCVENEAVATMSDVLIRRTGMLYFDRPRALAVRDRVEDELKRLTDRDDVGRAAFDQALNDVVAFRATE